MQKVRRLRMSRPPPGTDGLRETVRRLRAWRPLPGTDGLRGLWVWQRRRKGPRSRTSRLLHGMGGFRKDSTLECEAVLGNR